MGELTFRARQDACQDLLHPLLPWMQEVHGGRDRDSLSGHAQVPVDLGKLFPGLGIHLAVKVVAMGVHGHRQGPKSFTRN